ncbi:MAG: sodium:calcium antiporter [bacterium]
MFQLWLLFVALALIIYFSGSKLAFYGDVLGEKWGVERSFIGLILLSTITSLPELGTSVSSLLWVEAPDLAVGNTLGSNLFNIAIIPLLALLYRRAFLYRAGNQHNTTAALINFLYGLVGLALLVNLPLFPARLRLDFFISPFSIAIFIFYLGGLYFIFSEKNLPEKEKSIALLYENKSHRQTMLVFILCAFIVIAAAAGLARVGKTLADLTGFGDTFFGTLFFAFVTSLPEIVVSWAALKQLDSVNLALGNIFGSCLFNLTIIPLLDLISWRKNIFAELHFSNFISVFAGIIMVSLASYAIHVRRSTPAKKYFSLEMVLLALSYLIALSTIFLLR